MPTCPQCGSAEPDEAQWCGKCFLPFAPAPAVQAHPGVVTPVPAPVAPVPAPPPAPVPAPPPAPALAPAPMAPLDPPPPAWGAAIPLERADWAPPAGGPGWAPVPARPADPIAEGRLLSGRAFVIVVVSIALGAAYQGAVALLERNPNVSLSQFTRWNIALNVLVYVVVGGLVFSQVTPKVRLRWGDGPALMRIGFGAACGLLGGGLAVAATSAAEGHVSTDPRAIHMMSGGDFAHVAITMLLVCVAAPLVEETLFRGLLLESLRHHALNMAIVVSAMFFAVWHLSKAGLVYYTLMGCVFGGLYVKRGLVASMSAHAGFNGVLVLTALSIVLGPSHHYDIGGLRISVPGGWTKEDSGEALSELGLPIGDENALVVSGPDTAGIALIDVGPLPAQFDAGQVTQALRANLNSLPLPAGSSYDIDSLREETLPTVGPAVEMDLTIHSTAGELVFFSYGGQLYVTFGLLGDNPNARGDFEQILKTLQPAPVLGPAP